MASISSSESSPHSRCAGDGHGAPDRWCCPIAFVSSSVVLPTSTYNSRRCFAAWKKMCEYSLVLNCIGWSKVQACWHCRFFLQILINFSLQFCWSVIFPKRNSVESVLSNMAKFRVGCDGVSNRPQVVFSISRTVFSLNTSAFRWMVWRKNNSDNSHSTHSSFGRF